MRFRASSHVLVGQAVPLVTSPAEWHPRGTVSQELWAWMAVQGAHAARRFAWSRINFEGETATGQRGDQ
jgi:hypothetical protein